MPAISTALIIGAAAAVGSTGLSYYQAEKQQEAAAKQARLQREAQEKELERQRLLNAAAKKEQKEEDLVLDLGGTGSLAVGRRSTGKRTVKKASAAPSSTGLRVG